MSLATPSFCCRDDEAIRTAWLDTLKCEVSADFESALKIAKIWNLASIIIDITGHSLTGVLLLGTGFMIGFALAAPATLLEIITLGFLGIILAVGCLFITHMLKESCDAAAVEDLAALNKRI